MEARSVTTESELPKARPVPAAPTGNSGGNRGGRRGRPENLRPFKPGQSGNLSGRPKGSAGFAAKIRAATKEGKDLIAVAVSILRDVESKERMAAVKWLADRGWGKEPLELTVNEGIRIKLVRPS